MAPIALVTLLTDRLRLRRYRKGDVRYYPELYDRDGARRMIDNALRAYEKTGYSVLVVERLSDGAFLGHVGLLHWDDVDGREDFEVAYMLVPEAWGHGYATEAARACRDWAF